MTVTTTLKLPEALKSRITELAKSAGKTQYVFVVAAVAALAALAAQAQRSESRRDFVGAALRAEEEIAQDGEVYFMDAVHRYSSDKLAG